VWVFNYTRNDLLLFQKQKRELLMHLNNLPRCTPEEAGISSRRVIDCIEALDHDLTSIHGFMAARHGKVFAECWWAPFSSELVHCNHSLGKSYTATAIGIALKEGRLSLNEKMVDVFADEIAQRNIVVPDKMERITIKHVMTMTNGMAHHPSMTGDWIGNYFRTPMAYEPGTHFAYNSSGSCMLGAIILKRTGQNMKEYLTERLFNKIGIDSDDFVWLKFPNKIDAEPGTFARTEDNLRLAMLYVNGGSWYGEQILDPEFVHDGLSVQIMNPYAPEQKDGRCGYGYQLWACSIPGVYRFDGGQGQYGIIWPEKDLVVAIHEGAMAPLGPQKTLDTLYNYLLLELQDEPLESVQEDYSALLQLESSVKLQPDESNTLRLNRTFGGAYRISSGGFDPWISVAPPGSGDLFHAFRDQSKDTRISSFELDVSDEAFTITFDTGAKLIASWDGSLIRKFIESPFPDLGAYAASARFTLENALEITIHWLNGWFETLICFELAADKMKITTRKLRLNVDDNFLVYRTSAVLEI
jgi:CubicO group peptidase (beta-lactamase class C family)